MRRFIKRLICRVQGHRSVCYYPNRDGRGYAERWCQDCGERQINVRGYWVKTVRSEA
jgi:hypothetical protein